MSSENSLPIQYGIGSRPNSLQGVEKNHPQNTVVFPSPFSTRLDEKIIDVYERSAYSTAVPDERTGIERRQSLIHQPSFPEALPLPPYQEVATTRLHFANREANSTYTRAANTMPSIFSPPRETGTIIDTWA
jgi:hypothetical protein